MTEGWISLIFSSISGISIGIPRILMLFVMVPIFIGMQLKGTLRNGCAVALSLFLMPYITPSLDTSGLGVALLILKETILGVLLAGLLAMPFWIFDWVGIWIDSQRGALNGSVFNPALGSDSLIGGMLKQSVIIIFLAMNGLPLLLDVLWQSYLIWPPNEWMPMPQSDGIQLWLDHISHLFNATILYAAPIVICLLLIDFGMGILGLFSPQLEVSVLSMPIKSVLGLILLAIYLPKLWHLAEDEFAAFYHLPHLMKTLFVAG